MADSDSGRARADEDGEARADDERERRSPDALRREVEAEYDFENFGPADMARMTAEEWEAAFDADTWVTGPELLDRVEADLRARIAARDVFAVVEREPGVEGERVIAYSDEGYAIVREDGTVEGRGTVVRDVKPTVALASMEEYEVPDAPDVAELPTPEEVAEGSSDLGNKLMLAVAAVQVLAGAVLLVGSIVLGLPIIAPVAAVGFLAFGVLMFVIVANARLSDRFRAAEYRDRLRTAGVGGGERPPFVPPPGRDEPMDAPEGGESVAPDRAGTGTEGTESNAEETG